MDITPEQARAELARREQLRATQPKMGGSPPLSAVAAKVWDIAPQNPKNVLKNLPTALGAIGAVSPIPFGSTIGTATGQGIRYAGDKIFDQPVPSTARHGIELGAAALGDVTAFPALNRLRLGKQIGELEAKAKVPPAQDIKSIPMNLGQKTISQFIDDSMESVHATNKIGGQAAPEFWKQIKDQVDRIYQLGKDQALTAGDKGKLKFLSKAVQAGLNRQVPGRAAVAADLARSQAVPNFISNVSRSLPWWAKATGTALGGDALLRVLMHQKNSRQ